MQCSAPGVAQAPPELGCEGDLAEKNMAGSQHTSIHIMSPHTMEIKIIENATSKIPCSFYFSHGFLQISSAKSQEPLHAPQKEDLNHSQLSSASQQGYKLPTGMVLSPAQKQLSLELPSPHTNCCSPSLKGSQGGCLSPLRRTPRCSTVTLHMRKVPVGALQSH